METVAFAEWKRLQLAVGSVVEAERVPKTDKLYKLQVDVGQGRTVQIVTSLVPYYTEAELKDRKIIVLLNLERAKFGGEISEGMLLCAEKADGSECVLLTTERDIATGTPVT